MYFPTKIKVSKVILISIYWREWLSMKMWGRECISANCFHLSYFILSLSYIAVLHRLPSWLNFEKNILKKTIWVRGDDTSSILSSITKLVMFYCWRTNSLEQSFYSPSGEELWLELFSRHFQILHFYLKTTIYLMLIFYHHNKIQLLNFFLSWLKQLQCKLFNVQ